mgnify:CR=1 FL=1
MKIIFIFLAYTVFFMNISWGQESGSKYRRSSLYTMLITHPSDKFGKDIEDVFISMPTPDKFDNHDLNVKTVQSPYRHKAKRGGTNEEWSTLTTFLDSNAVARRVVAKWFNRDKRNGTFDMSLVAYRGHYNASELDVQLAKASVRGTGLLADAGEELVGNTFIMVNDIRYVDKEERGKMWGSILQGIGEIAGAAVGGDTGEAITSLGNTAQDFANMIAGFRVIVTSYLYRLEWNEEVANTFYQDYYTDASSLEPHKIAAFQQDRTTFRLKYIGHQIIDSGKTSMNGIEAANNDALKSQMIRKVCTRALDKSIVELQKEHEEFKVKVPILKVEPYITAQIGLKEGLTSKSKFEVLEQYQDENGRTRYKRVGVVKPEGTIWDNRYMAVEEKASGANLNETRFKKVSGGTFYPGMLLREIKFKKN